MVTSKVRRRESRKVIAAGINELYAADPAPSKPISRSFRLVIWTQYRENYGAHCDPPCHYWKCKPSGEFKYHIGTALDVIRLGSKGLEEMVRQAKPDIEHSSFYSEEYIAGWQIYGDMEMTEDEEMDYWFANEYGIDRSKL